jgi:hypothetical protein
MVCFMGVDSGWQELEVEEGAAAKLQQLGVTRGAPTNR